MDGFGVAVEAVVAVVGIAAVAVVAVSWAVAMVPMLRIPRRKRVARNIPALGGK